MSTDRTAAGVTAADRYGTGPRLGRRTRTVLLGALGAVAVAVAAWFGIAAGSAPVTWQEVGFTLADDHVDLVFDVSRPDPSVPVVCTVEALDQSYGQVGVTEVAVPPAEARTVRQRVEIRVVAAAVTGVVRECAPA